MILAASRAELFKLVRRPAVWVSIGLFLAVGVGVDYLLTYLVAVHPPSGRVQTGENSPAALLASLSSASLVPKALSDVSTLGGIFAVILGVLVQGSEYTWETVKTSLIQLPGRLTMVAGRLIALALLLALMTGSLFLLDSVASWAIGSAHGAATAYPAALDIAEGLGGGWLILAVLATFGFALATLFKQSAMAIGLGVAYTLVIESIVFALLGQLGGAVNQIHTYFPIANTDYLAQSFGYVPSIVGVSVSATSVHAMHAVAVLLVWIATFIVLSGLLTRARDVN
jgi:ABC-type transport system involved in multi-copper enzyme maturation permease subunit